MFPRFPIELDERLSFPDPRHAASSGPWNGLVALGGDFSIPRLLLAYRHGIFPWTSDPITWWSPDPRAVLELEDLHISRSLAAVLRRAPFEITVNRDFPGVMRGCAEPAPGREHTWISPRFITGYTELHAAGHAHSLECWQAGRLVGGIYGVAVGGLFAGESMFRRVDHASKVALVHLVHRLRDQGFHLLDVQALTPTTRHMGAREIPRTEYLDRLAELTDAPVKFA